MKFPKNTAIQVDTYKQVKQLKKLFGIEGTYRNNKNKFDSYSGIVCLSHSKASNSSKIGIYNITTCTAME